MRLGPPPEARGGARASSGRTSSRDTAPEFRKPTIEQLETFIAPTWGADRRRPLRRRPRCARSSTSCSPTSSSRTTSCAFPALLRAGAAVGADRLVQPGRDARSGVPPVFSGYAAGDRAGWDEFWAAYDRPPRAALGRLRRVLPRARRARARAALVHARVARPEPLPVSRRGRLRRASGRSARRGTGSTPACARSRRGRRPRRHPPRRRRADLPVARLARLGRRRPDAAARRRAGRHAAPVHRLEGPAGRRDRAPPTQWGAEYLPQPVDPAAGRPGDHARRQQHRPPSASTTACRWSPCRCSGTSTTTPSASTSSASDGACATYEWEPAELSSAIDGILGDTSISDRMQKISARVKADPGRVRAADLIERAARA